MAYLTSEGQQVSIVDPHLYYAMSCQRKSNDTLHMTQNTSKIFFGMTRKVWHDFCYIFHEQFKK